MSLRSVVKYFVLKMIKSITLLLVGWSTLWCLPKRSESFFCNEQSAQRDLVHISLELNF